MAATRSPHERQTVSVFDMEPEELIAWSLHGQWAQWILVEDEGTRFGLDMGIHPDALLGPILPPVAKF